MDFLALACNEMQLSSSKGNIVKIELPVKVCATECIFFRVICKVILTVSGNPEFPGFFHNCVFV